MMKLQDIPEIAEFSIPEKILLLEDLWENIAINDSRIPVPQSHVDELEKRNKRYQSDPGSLLTLDQLRINIDARK
jgi:putative addiction module component (TIGR02574 family)